MTQPNFRELALQGDAKAISVLLNFHLQIHGLTAEANVKDGCLHIFLTSPATVPDRQNCLEFVRQEITDLEPQSIERVKVYGYLEGKKEPVWSQEFGLEFGAYSMLISSQVQKKQSGLNLPASEEETPPLSKQFQRWPFVVAGILIFILVVSGLVFVGEKFLHQQSGNFEKIQK